MIFLCNHDLLFISSEEFFKKNFKNRPEMDKQKSTEQANLFDCFKFLNPMREKSRRKSKSKSKSQINKEPESTGIDWMEVSSTVR